MFTLGIDLGSTTVKYALLDETCRVLAHDYTRHASAVTDTLVRILENLQSCVHLSAAEPVRVLFSGSGALGIAATLKAPFVQEVIAASTYLKAKCPEIDVAVELGGEDAKLLYLSRGVELRMNEACAGGTGAFIDQMASLLDTDAAGLDRLASEASISHPMASRCGVFAKTDLVALLNAGVSKAEVARSALDAVAEQTVSGLACGRPIVGNVAFLGGPLGFLSQLRAAFERRLASPCTQFHTFDDAPCAVAIGTALAGIKDTGKAATEGIKDNIGVLIAELKTVRTAGQTGPALSPLFANGSEKQEFLARHRQESVARAELKDAVGDLFLGIDLGSTTIKGAVLDQAGRLVYSWYEQNEGQPLLRLYDAMKTLLPLIPEGARLRQACTTGYGADLAKAALGAQFLEVETLAHQRAAVAFNKDVSYVIDIGGQDMKCLEVKGGLITSVKLNEACSSGCGSFLQTFAKQLNLSLDEFVEAALASKAPCDLGTRCTVFMNSRVRQAQRDGAKLEDIAAGLCRSIVRNALYKVLRIHDPKDLGEHVVVQGGTFLNDAVLRAFEQQIGHNVIRPDIAGLMGAYGAALIAMEKTVEATPILDLQIEAMDIGLVRQHAMRCKGCNNHCELTMSRFPSGEKFFSGNRCDFAQKSAGAKKKTTQFVDWKLDLLFNREPLDVDAAPMGTVGIARALNTYEHYPYWFSLFSELGFRVVLSDASSRAMAGKASATIPSQSLCFPAKLAHGHVHALAQAGVHDIWMPCIPHEGWVQNDSDGRYACPVVGGYPEALRLSIASTLPETRILTPFVDLAHPQSVVREILKAWPELKTSDVKRAVKTAQAALATYQATVRRKGETLWHEHVADGRPLVVLAGRPYHLDPLINHGLPALIESMGATVVTEDAVSHLAEVPDDLSVVNQWTFHARLYRAAALVRESRSAELVQLVSFGCGIDAITTEQIERLLSAKNRIATTIKIDEGDTLGAARIRLKSLLAAVNDRKHSGFIEIVPEPLAAPARKPAVTLKAKKIKQTRTIYAPQMAPLHFPLLTAALQSIGWNVELLPDVRPQAIEEGLKHVNNDACYPAIVVIGQLLDALKTKEIEPDKSVLLLSQTCGPCRATNYPTQLKWALKDIGLEDVPVVCLSGGKVQGAEMLDVGLTGLKRLMIATVYGDLLQRLSFYVRAHELNKGEADKLVKGWTMLAKPAVMDGNVRQLAKDAHAMVADFMSIPMDGIEKPRVGIVGEILLKYHPVANLGIVQEIIDEGLEPVLGDLSSFFLYCLNDRIYQAQFGGNKARAWGAKLLIQWFERVRSTMRDALAGTPLEGVSTLTEDLQHIEGLVSPGQEAGEGWLLTAEMSRFLQTGTDNVVCLQPFGCLPNHITGKGVMRHLRETRPFANLCAIDFEAGTSKTNVTNRLKLFLAQAKENFAKKSAGFEICEPPRHSASAVNDTRVIQIMAADD
ncbi:MAG: acyl-CoA dehydratase activase-related protein [Sutterellaceae bacterium]|nr:acyl-CoA dehydratase activase-related protein [Sutterellaceae bacterium]